MVATCLVNGDYTSSNGLDYVPRKPDQPERKPKHPPAGYCDPECGRSFENQGVSQQGPLTCLLGMFKVEAVTA